MEKLALGILDARLQGRQPARIHARHQRLAPPALGPPVPPTEGHTFGV